MYMIYIQGIGTAYFFKYSRFITDQVKKSFNDEFKNANILNLYCQF